MTILSSRSKYALNPIQEEDAVVEKMVRGGEEIIRMNRGDPPVYFPTPEYIINSFVEALKKRKTSYSNPVGVLELREAIANRYKRLYNVATDSEHIVVTQGISEALFFLNASLINDKDRGIVFRPYYTQYMPDLEFYGGKAVIERYDESLNWNIDVEKLESTIKKQFKSNRKPKYMIITNPNNPTGTVLDYKVLRKIVDIANNYGILLVSDEIYDEIIFNGAKFTSISQVAKGVPHLILNGASKDYDATGFRIGYAVFPEDDKISNDVKNKFKDLARVRLSANTPAQYAFADAIDNIKEHKKHITSMVSKIEKNVNFAADLINSGKYMHSIVPRGAFYIFPKVSIDKLNIKNDKEFIDKLLKEEKVWLTRGSGFGEPNHVRFVLLADKEIISTAIKRVERFCNRHKKGA
jgi:alanine-synthesizing transaminase